jgi:hypothetical protein
MKSENERSLHNNVSQCSLHRITISIPQSNQVVRFHIRGSHFYCGEVRSISSTPDIVSSSAGCQMEKFAALRSSCSQHQKDCIEISRLITGVGKDLLDTGQLVGLDADSVNQMVSMQRQS